jgi:protein TonB
MMPDTLAAWDTAALRLAPAARAAEVAPGLPLAGADAAWRRARAGWRGERLAGVGIAAVVHGVLAVAVLVHWVVERPVKVEVPPVVMIQPPKPLEPPRQAMAADRPALFQPRPLAVVTPPVAIEVPATAPVVAAPPAPPPPAPAVPAGTGTAAASFQELLMAHLERHKRYPAAARRQMQQGVVQVAFTMDRGGHVLAVRLARSSGYSILDDEALAVLRRADPLPALPPDRGAAADFVVPISFSLQRRG